MERPNTTNWELEGAMEEVGGVEPFHENYAGEETQPSCLNDTRLLPWFYNTRTLEVPANILRDNDEVAPAQLVGRQLALIADDVNEKYYTGVAETSWGCTVVLLALHYGLTVWLLKGGTRGRMRQLSISLIPRFARSNTLGWVNIQRGSEIVLRHLLASSSWSMFGFVVGVASLPFLAATVFTHFR